VFHAVVQDLDHIQVVNLDLEAVHILAVDHVQEVVRLHEVIRDRIADLGLAQHLAANRVHNLVVNQDHQLDQNLVVVLLQIHQLIQEVDLHPIHTPNLPADLLLDLGKYRFLWFTNSVIII